MQNATYKQSGLSQHRLAWQSSLVALLLDPLHDSVRDTTLHALWELASSDWQNFAQGLSLGDLQGPCGTSDGVDAQMNVVAAFARDHPELESEKDFVQFMNKFVNDVRFSAKVSSGKLDEYVFS